MINGEDVLRIEHKLDAILWYLKEMTGVPPRDMPKQIPGLGGLTNGKCPITNTDIYYLLDVNTGKVSRFDGLKSGVTSGSAVKMPDNKPNNTILLRKVDIYED
jgi:hypothetical protein